jgi:hypothetical protein
MSSKIFNSIITLMIVFILIIFSIYQVILHLYDFFFYESLNRPFFCSKNAIEDLSRLKEIFEKKVNIKVLRRKNVKRRKN